MYFRLHKTSDVIPSAVSDRNKNGSALKLRARKKKKKSIWYDKKHIRYSIGQASVFQVVRTQEPHLTDSSLKNVEWTLCARAGHKSGVEFLSP